MVKYNNTTVWLVEPPVEKKIRQKFSIPTIKLDDNTPASIYFYFFIDSLTRPKMKKKNLNFANKFLVRVKEIIFMSDGK